MNEILKDTSYQQNPVYGIKISMRRKTNKIYIFETSLYSKREKD